MDPTIAGKSQCDIRVVDTYGRALQNAEVQVRGVRLARNSLHLFELSRGTHELKVSAKGFEPYVGNVEITERFHTFVFCLRLGALWNRGPNRIMVEVAAPKDDEACSTLVALPLHCAQCRSATFHPLLKGRYGFDNLEPGSYIFAVLAENRTCLTARIDVPDEPGATIKIGNTDLKGP
jgi:hypothetical protein